MIYSSKTLSYAVIVFINFLTGIEYAVILPTALQYLQQFGGDEFYLGLCLSAYSFSSLFSSPIFGKWSDKINNAKLIMLFSNIWQIVGSFMYFIGYSKWLLIAGRLVAGVGLGVVACCFSEIVKTTGVEKRGKILARVMMGRQFGLVIGPAANFIFYNIDVNINIGPWSWRLNNLSAPGLLMSALWLLLEIFIIFFYKNLSEFPPEDESQPTAVQPINQADEEANERTSLLDGYRSFDDGSQEHQQQQQESNVSVIQNSTNPSFGRLFWDEYIREEVIAVFSITFTVFFMQTALETLLTPITRELFGWTDKQNSIMYACCGFEILVVFLLLSFLTKRISERVFLLVGLIGNLLTLIFFIIYTPYAKRNASDFVSVLIFFIPVAANVFSLPLIALGSISILSKITNADSQGQTQGIRRMIVGVSTILGPLWSGGFYGKWYILFGALIAIVGMSLVMLLASFKWLKPRNNT